MAPQAPVKIILGTHTIGDSVNGKLVGFDSTPDVQALLNKFRSRGYTDLDTAANYPDYAPGTTEDRLGKAGAASQFTIHTKVLDGANNTPSPHQPAKLAASIDQSLASLKTKTVETIFLHVPDRTTPLEDAARAINDAIKQGKARKFGLSNYSPAEVQQFLDICDANGFVKPSVYQGQYNAIVRGGEKELFPLLRQHNISFYAFSPAAGGLFSSNAKNAERWKGDSNIAKLYSSMYSKPAVQDSIDLVAEAVAKHDMTGHEAALRWVAYHSVLDGKHGDALIFGVSKLEQLDKTLDALERGPLPEDVADAMTAVYATVEGSEPAFHL